MNVIQIWLFDLKHWSALHLPFLSHHWFHTLIILVTLWDVKKHPRIKFRKQITMQKETIGRNQQRMNFILIDMRGWVFISVDMLLLFFLIPRVQSKHNSNLVYYHMLYPFDNKCWRASGAKYFHYIMMYGCVSAKQRKLSALLFSRCDLLVVNQRKQRARTFVRPTMRFNGVVSIRRTKNQRLDIDFWIIGWCVCGSKQ